MLRISGYGQSGPYRDRPGFGVVAEAMGGLRHLTAEPGRVPVRVGVSIGDTLASLHGVIGVLMACSTAQQRRGAGRGQVVDVALYEAVFNCMESLLPEYSAFGMCVSLLARPCPASRRATPTRAATARAHRRQRRLDLQAPDARHRPRRPRCGSGAGRQCRPGRARGRDRRGDRRMDRAARRAEVLAALTRPTCRRAASIRRATSPRTRTTARAT